MTETLIEFDPVDVGADRVDQRIPSATRLQTDASAG